MRFLVKIAQNSMVRMVTALLVCGVFSAAVLVLVYSYTMPRILENQEREMQRAVMRIFPEAETFNELRQEVFEVLGAAEEKLGYAFTATGTGYQGEIKLMLGATPDLERLKGMAVLESQETPGLGAEIQNPDFKQQFEGLDVSGEVEYVKSRTPEQPYQIEAITGATISTGAVVDIVNSAMRRMREELEVR